MRENINQALRDIIKGAGVIYAGLLIQAFISFLAQVLAARFLTTSGFGGITVGTALLDIGSIVGSVGLAEGLIRYLPRAEDSEKGNIVMTTLVVSAVASTVIAVAVVLNTSFLATTVFGDPSVETALTIFGAAIPFATVLFVAIGGIRGQKVARYRVYVKNIVQPLLRFLCVGIVVVLGLGEAGFAGAYTLPYVVTSLVATYLVIRTLPSIDLRGIGRSALPTDMFEYSLPFIVHSLASFIHRSIDIFLVLYLLDSGHVGTYGVAYASARLMLLFSSALNFLGAPVASELEADEGMDAVLEIQFSAVRWLTILSIPTLVPLAVYAPEFIELIYRPRYAPGAGALAVLAIGFGIHNLFSVQANVFRAVGNSRHLASVSAVGALVNVALNLLLIPEYQIVGAAIATVASYFLQDALMFGIIYRWYGEAPVSGRIVPPIVLGAPLLVGLVALKPALPTSLFTLVGVSTVFGVAYLLLILAVLGLDEKEVMLARSAQERFGVEHRAIDWALTRFS